MKKLLPLFLFVYTILVLAATALEVFADETAVPSNEFGLLRVDSPLANTIVAVPWAALSGTDAAASVSVADFVKTANLTAGDKLYAHNATTGLYDVWELQDGAWKPVTTVDVATGAGGAAPEAAGRALARGSALWLVRQNPVSNGAPVPFYLYGQAVATAPATSVVAGTAAAPVWNLVANPAADSCTLDGCIENAGASDEVYLVADGAAPVKYTLKNGKWGRYVYATRADGKLVSSWSTADAAIPGGTGFWYVSKGGTPTFNW